MTHRLRPEDEAASQRRDTSHRLRTIERWLQHAEEELLYAPDASEEAAQRPSAPVTIFAGERAA